mmetsp:Transcript_12181/g.24943  ORF Transcript_12181/g.24943 Transcript_12181/m.24943 type:complete len:255 (-) Transcript_12181:1497-2261(-)
MLLLKQSSTSHSRKGRKMAFRERLDISPQCTHCRTTAPKKVHGSRGCSQCKQNCSKLLCLRLLFLSRISHNSTRPHSLGIFRPHNLSNLMPHCLPKIYQRRNSCMTLLPVQSTFLRGNFDSLLPHLWKSTSLESSPYTKRPQILSTSRPNSSRMMKTAPEMIFQPRKSYSSTSQSDCRSPPRISSTRSRTLPPKHCCSYPLHTLCNEWDPKLLRCRPRTPPYHRARNCSTRSRGRTCRCRKKCRYSPPPLQMFP